MSSDGVVRTAVDHSGGPDVETLRAAVRMGCWAPSAHNTQPWRWGLVPSGGLRLSADRSRWLVATDPAGRDLLVSCGVVLHHVRVALAAFGWSAAVSRFPDPADPDLLAEVRMTPAVPGQADVADAVSITRRHSDRRAFAPQPVGHEVMSDLLSRAAREGVVAEVVEGEARTTLHRLFAGADAAQRADTDHGTGLSEWNGRADGPGDGALAGETPVQTTAGGPVLHGFVGGEQPPGSGAHGGSLLVLGTTADDEESRLRAGEAASAVLLGATARRLASCALSRPVEVASVRQMLRTLVLRSAAEPQLVVRLGQPAPGAPELPRTSRRPLESVLGEPGLGSHASPRRERGGRHPT